MLKQNANEGCNSCASLAGLVLSFIACLILLVIAPLFTKRVGNFAIALAHTGAGVFKFVLIFSVKKYDKI